MKKSIWFILLFTIAAKAQIRVSYQAYPGGEEQPKEGVPAHLLETAAKSRKAAANFIFLLDISKKRAHFYLDDKMTSDADADNAFYRNLAIAEYIGGEAFWIDVASHRQIRKTNGKHIASDLLELEWKKTSESKKIGDYECFKAECVISYTTWKGQPASRTIVAWFAPELPYSFGPAGYFGLPGLILELYNGNTTTFVAKSITMTEMAEIRLPVKTVDQKENAQSVKETMDGLKNN